MIDELTSLGTKGTIFRNQNIETQYPLARLGKILMLALLEKIRMATAYPMILRTNGG